MIQPMGLYLVVKIVEQEATTGSGIVIAPQAVRNAQHGSKDIGKVLAVSDAVKEEIKPGEYILFNKVEVEVAGKPYHLEEFKTEEGRICLVHLKDVLSIVVDPPKQYLVN